VGKKLAGQHHHFFTGGFSMARTCSLLWVLLPAAVLAPAAPALKDRPPKEPPIIGEWVRVGHTNAGAPVAPDREPHHQVFTADGQWEYSYGGRQGSAGQKTFVTDTRQNPPTIDIHMDKAGRASYRGVYKVEGDTLTLCLVMGDQDRPKTFESSPDKPTTVWVFKRVKPKD
jgi:uncharacterized protein (TIGR03067 family)